MSIFDKNRLDFSVSRPMCVLIPSMGAGNMPDFDNLKAEFESFGIQVLNPDLSEKMAFEALPWDRIAVVDLSNMRGCLTSFDKYLGILDRIEDHTRKASKYFPFKPNVVPNHDALIWISSKARYLSYLSDNDVATIPTLSLCKMKDPNDQNIIAQPDNLEACFQNIHDYIHQSPKNKFVLKPSTSSLARGLVFIDYCSENNSYSVTTPSEDGNHKKSVYGTFEDLANNALEPYFLHTASYDRHFLFQEYIENLETSAVFVNGTPHYVERTQGEDSHIAHAKFGGQDKVISNPDPKLVDFVYKVRDTLPQDVKDSLFLRVDVMKNLETDEYILSELEGAGAIRLWLTESNRVEDYARMMVHFGLKEQPINDNSANTDPFYENSLNVS